MPSGGLRAWGPGACLVLARVARRGPRGCARACACAGAWS